MGIVVPRKRNRHQAAL